MHISNICESSEGKHEGRTLSQSRANDEIWCLSVSLLAFANNEEEKDRIIN